MRDTHVVEIAKLGLEERHRDEAADGASVEAEQLHTEQKSVSVTAQKTC